MKKYKYSEIKGKEILTKLVNKVYNMQSYDDVVPLEMTKAEAKEFARKHLAKSCMPLIPLEYRDDNEFMRDMITSHYPINEPSVMKYASERLRNDPEFCKFAIKHHKYHATQWIGKKLLNDPKFFIEVFNMNHYDTYDSVTMEDYATEANIAEDLMKKAGPAVLGDKKIILRSLHRMTCKCGREVFASDLLWLRTIPKGYLNDKRYVLQMIRITPQVYDYLDTYLQDDPDIIYATCNSMLRHDVTRMPQYLRVRLSKSNSKLKRITKILGRLGETSQCEIIRRARFNKAYEEFLAKEFKTTKGRSSIA